MADKDKRLVRASYRKALSDGNYGTESAEVTLEWFIPDDEVVNANEDQAAAEEMLKQASDIVHRQLKASFSKRIRQGAMAPAPTAATVGAGDEDPF